MLTLRNIRKSFEETEVLKGVNLTIEKGEVISIIGPSGTGKTTLLRCADFLEKVDEGSMEFDGENYDLLTISKKQIEALRKKTAFVFQTFNLFANKTALENITLPLIVGKKADKEHAKATALKLLDKVGLNGKGDLYPSQLSGGQQQRVAIARALALEPEIIFFDEPTSALDPLLINEVLNVIKELANEKMTMLIVTHELNFARSVSDKIAYMQDGEILEIGSPDQIFNHPVHESVKDFIQTVGGKNEKD